MATALSFLNLLVFAAKMRNHRPVRGHSAHTASPTFRGHSGASSNFCTISFLRPSMRQHATACDSHSRHLRKLLKLLKLLNTNSPVPSSHPSVICCIWASMTYTECHSSSTLKLCPSLSKQTKPWAPWADTSLFSPKMDLDWQFKQKDTKTWNSKTWIQYSTWFNVPSTIWGTLSCSTCLDIPDGHAHWHLASIHPDTECLGQWGMVGEGTRLPPLLHLSKEYIRMIITSSRFESKHLQNGRHMW